MRGVLDILMKTFLDELNVNLMYDLSMIVNYVDSSRFNNN